MHFPRSSGVLVHLSSLPSKYGIGDLGPEAYRFVDWLKKANQELWQLLPFSIADGHGCPYSGFSAYGGYPLLISPQKMMEDNLLTPSDLTDVSELFGRSVKYADVEEYKMFLFHKAFANLKNNQPIKDEFYHFFDVENEWLDDLALFIVLTEQIGGQWYEWPQELKHHDITAIENFKKKNGQQLIFHKFLQFLFFRQWKQLKAYANSQGIKLIGDLPIFLSHHSMDVWKNPELFKLNQSGTLDIVTGAPPDQFSATGQVWGNPNYNWWQMEQDGFQWWIKRMRFILKHYDIVRLDHFRGFAATWEVPINAPDARSGQWSWVPGDNIFHCFRENLGDIPIIVEDLGKITDDVIWLRHKYDLPGMKILQMAFGSGHNNINLPHNFPNHCVVYTGTHDNDTSKGWFAYLGHTLERDFAINYSGAWNTENMNWSLIALALNSRADMAIIPLQDIMGLGSEARFNKPGTADNNWTWRFTWEELKESDQNHLGQITLESRRNCFRD